MTVPDTPYEVRRTPTQYRASRRIERILDAASRVAAEKGFSGTTTADIAKAAKVSIGSVYRYFPDKLAVMKAVHGRNSVRYRELVREATKELGDGDWRAAVDRSFAIYVDMCRTDDGFRAVSKAGLAATELDENGGPEDPLADTLSDLLVDRFGFADTADLRTALLQCVTVGDVLTRLAFRLVDAGHQDTLAKTHRIIVDLVAEHAPD
ncbi:TetR/AcrR family transcriptional regulator [Actinokineospora sp. NPDC004072]